MTITNPITKNNLNVFVKDYYITEFDEPTRYEFLNNYLIYWKTSGGIPDLEELEHISTGKEYGIDGTFILINGKLVFDLEEFKDEKSREVDFVFIQSKTGSFDKGEYLKFIDAVKNYFDFNIK